VVRRGCAWRGQVGHSKARLEMVRFTLEISKELNDWLIEQARLNLRSKSKHIEHLLKSLMKTQEEKELLRSNGQ